MTNFKGNNIIFSFYWKYISDILIIMRVKVNKYTYNKNVKYYNESLQN